MGLASIFPSTASLLLWIFEGQLIWQAQSHFSRICSSVLYIDTRVYQLGMQLLMWMLVMLFARCYASS